jgi:hypothetical protein
MLRPQLVPTGALKLPQITLPRNPLVYYIVGAAIVVLAVLYALSRITGAAQAPVRPPNGLWLGTEWTYALEGGETEDLVTRLREYDIGTVYAWISWLKPDLTWGGVRDRTNQFTEVEATVKNFVTEFNEAYPEARLYGWISVPANEVDIGNLQVQQAIVDFSQKAVNDLGFEGVHLNIEPVWNNDTNFLALVNKVRLALGESVLISAAIPPDWSPVGANIPVPPLIVPGTVWDERYKQSVALAVDELALMAYNSGLSSTADYSQWVAYQVQTYARAVAALDTGAGPGVELMIGVPTYDAEPPGHDPLVENVPSALEGIKIGLEQAGDAARYVSGAAIYADWVTEDSEWAQFALDWVSAR